MARNFRNQRPTRGKARETLWIGGAMVTTTLAAASTAALVTSLPAGILALRPFTIVRTRGFWHLRSDQLAGSETYGCHYANCVVSDQAAAIGITAVPTPATDSGSDLFHVYESLFSRFTGIATIEGFEMNSGISSQFDSKAMRKVEDEQQLIEVVETPALVGGGAVVTTYSRTLIKLH